MARGRAIRAAATLLTAALLLAACGGAARDAPIGGDDRKVQPGGATDAYRQALATAGRPLSTAFAAMANAKSLAPLADRLAEAERAASQAAEQLDQVTPPEAVRAEHNDLVDAFRQLNGDLSFLRDEVDGRELCASSAVMSRLGKADGMAAVRAASKALAAKGGAQTYTVGLQVPAASKEQNRRLPNGQFVRQGSRTGRGQLTIENNSERDTVITLALGERPTFSVYVRNGSKDKVTGIRDGSYKIYYTTGVDWDPRARAFTRECVFQRFDDTFKFTTTRTATHVEWTEWVVDLQPRVGANANISEVDPAHFPAS